jgi:hypothetical protein
MALITCTECGGQVSDKASACPKCGHPLRATAPSAPSGPVCPKCGAASISGQKEGFGLKKGCCGTILLGPIGLLCGMCGANKVKVVCLSCGNEWVPGR